MKSNFWGMISEPEEDWNASNMDSYCYLLLTYVTENL